MKGMDRLLPSLCSSIPCGGNLALYHADAKASPQYLRVDHFRDFIGGKPIPAC